MSYGKIINYNGSSGYIVDEKGIKYILLKQNLLYDDACEGDYVSFKIEDYITIEIHEKIATFIKKIK